MKVVFRGNNTADVSEIQSVSVITAAKRIEVHFKRKMGETEEKVCDLPIHSPFFRKKWAEEVAKDLEKFSEAPETPIEQVIASTAWARGYLQVELDVNSDTSTRGLARLCWYRSLSSTRTGEELVRRTGLSSDEIEKIARRDIYKQFTEALILETYNTPDKFKKWVRGWGRNMSAKLGKIIRLSEDTTAELINSGAEKHGIDLSELKGSLTLPRKNTIPNSDLDPERTIGSGNSSVYLYYYPQYRESSESKGEKVWKCKIGKTKHREADGRVRGQATGLPESPKIGLHIKTDWSKEIEDIIHNILKVRGKHITDAPGTEWFLTSPNEVEEIYNFIRESSRESASSTLP
ncbi:MAG: GIY-YIG nuclease family protein [Candidatus Poribacteria bacterium]|nr:GIY-YIG nuclease family protein [Candidatus Poribacteria bacterium]